MSYKIIIIASFLMLFGTVLKSQPYYFRHYQAEQGLSHNSVTCSFQDSQGFMWFGTKDGLNRFDGYTFKIFRSDAEDPTSIGSNSILNICENNGKLWIGTDKGLYQYNKKTEKFKLLEPTSKRYIRDISRDSQGNLWFIADFTLFKYQEKSQTLQSYDKSNFDATAICSTSAGSIWISSTEGTINQYDPAHDTFTSFNVFEHSKPTATHWIETVYATGQQSLLIGTQSQGIKLFDLEKGVYKDLLSSDPDSAGLFVRDFVKNTVTEYWIATESGIYLLDLEKERLTNLRKSYNDPYSISDNAVYTVHKDREGGIWAGTYFGGANYYPRQYTSFEKFFPKIGENSISGNAVREICQDQYGHLWIGTEDAGLNRYEPQTGTFINFKPGGKKSDIAHYNIHGLHARGDELWIGTFHQGLDVMDILSGKIIRHYAAGSAPGSLKSDFVYAFLETPAGELFVGTAAGLYKYQQESDNFSSIAAFPEIYQYTVLWQDTNGTLWAGTYRDGIFYYNPKTQEKGHFRNEPENKNSLSSNAINGIFEDSKHNLWFTTEDGLNKFNPQQQQFKRYTTHQGLPSNVIYRMLEDQDQNLWISTSKGLVWFDPASEEIEVYTKAHGLLSDQLNYSSSYQDQEGRMYFGSVKGLISFKHSEFIHNTFIPPIYLTGFQIQNKELPVEKDDSPLEESITFTDLLTLNHDQSSFSLDFAALSYTAPQIIAYAYKMEGLDKAWTYLETNRKVFFTELPPGNYTFLVKASNSSGLWNEKATELRIEILPPFWASYWAYLFYGLIATVLLYYGVHSYHKKAEKKQARKISLLENEKEKEIYQAKIEFFTNIAHEIRTPLTLIKGPLEKVIKISPHNSPEIKDLLTIMEKNTSRLLNLVNQLLDFRKIETRGLSLSFAKTDVTELIKETYFRFRPAAAQKQLNTEINLPETPLYAYVDREALTKILSNLFNNAIKYAEKKVEIHLLNLQKDDQCFTVEIKNDGYLIAPEAKEKIFTPFFRIKETDNKPGTGIGLPLSRFLAELHHGSLKLKAPDNDLNVFVLSLPLHQEKEYSLYDEQATNTLPARPGSAANESEVIYEKSNKKASTGAKKDTKPGILLVEDNAEMQAFIAGELSGEYAIFTAPDGKAALQILETEIIQLIVSDIMMPVMNGIELCKQVKYNLESSHIPVILLTARNTLQSKIEGLETGADAYMEKPFSAEHLRVQIANLLSNRSKIKDFFSSSPLAHIKSIAYSKADEKFLEALNDAIYKNINDTHLNVEQLAAMMNMSRPTLYRKIKAISDLTPNELINLARLKRAAELMAEDNYKIYEIADIVGYNSQTSFGRNFQKQFGMTPSEYVNAKKAV